MKNFLLIFTLALFSVLSGCVIPYYNFGYGSYSACPPSYYQYPYYEGYWDNYKTFYPTYYYRACPNHFYNCSRNWPASYNFCYFAEAPCYSFAPPYPCPPRPCGTCGTCGPFGHYYH